MIESSTFAQTRYLRASRYDMQWVLQHRMGPDALWLEWQALCQAVTAGGPR